MARRSGLSLFIVLLIFAQALPTEAPAFQISKSDASGAELRWPAPHADYFVNPSGGPPDSIAAVQAAMQTWTDVGTSTFTFVYNGETSNQSFPAPDRTNIIGFASMGTADGTLAENMRWYIPITGEIVDTDIRFNTDFPWATDGSADAFDFQNVVTHELGHSLSLDDLYGPGDINKTMYGLSDFGETTQRTLDPDDINGITYLYPSISLPVPTLVQDFGYPPAVDPAFGADPAQNMPLSVGDTAHGEVSFHLSFLPFTGPVDIYAAYMLSTDPDVINVLRTNLSFQAVPAEEVVSSLTAGVRPEGVLPWMANTRGPVDEIFFPRLILARLPHGTYTLYILVAPAGSLDTYYLWTTYLTVP